VGKSVFENPIPGVEMVMEKKATLDVPPPGPGLTTVTDAVLALAMSEANTVAVSRESFTKRVVLALPFQCTTEVDTKPVPFTVSWKPAPPGALASGTKGWLISGTGLAAC